MIRVVIAEDHNLIREALARMLVESGRIEVAAEASNGNAAVDLTKKHKPDVLLLDVTMPGKDGIQALSELGEMGLPTKVIVLTMHEDGEQPLCDLGWATSDPVLVERSAYHYYDGEHSMTSSTGETYTFFQSKTGNGGYLWRIDEE